MRKTILFVVLISIAFTLNAAALECSIHALTGPNFTHQFDHADEIPFRTSLKSDVRVDFAFNGGVYSLGIYAQYGWTTESIVFNNTRLPSHHSVSSGLQMAYIFNDQIRAGLSVGIGKGLSYNGKLKYTDFEGSLFFRYDILEYLSVMAAANVEYTGRDISPSLQIGVGVPFSVDF